MIPKIIHYCWFGSNPMPGLAKRCVSSWKKHCSDYEIICWNERNFNINTVPFTMQVAKVKKWGFIVDYIRAHVVYYYGGIYLDTDVELLKPFDSDMLRNICFSGFENKRNIAPGLIFAGVKGCHIAKELMDFYADYNFIQKNGDLNLTASPKIFTNMLIKYGLKRNNTYQELGMFTSYPTEYFCPMSLKSRMINVTKNTYCIHHYAGSWLSEEDVQRIDLRKKICAMLGDNIFSQITIILLIIIRRIRTYGLFDTVKYCYQKYIDR